MTKHVLLLCIAFIFSTSVSRAQDFWGVGVSGAYNFPLKSIGVGVRGQIPLGVKMAVSPQVRYFPKTNQINEVYAAVAFQYNLLNPYQERGHKRYIYKNNKPTVYTTIEVAYNQWINYLPTLSKNAKKDNILGNVGLGAAIGSSSVRLFAEAKYNVLWNETFGEIGLLVFPGIIRKNRYSSCPKIK